ncbi:MAG: preprotein translocase subunit SecG [Desulfamplus sp.]|nr:preprotein translocase subunit SecG [Desulfamplus sp.]
MTTFILFIHIISCILLILIVLLQTGKGADMGASFGSASGGQSLFGGAGPATALSKITTVVAIVFMLTSLTMAYTSGHKSSQTIMPATSSSTVNESAKDDVKPSDENTTTANSEKQESSEQDKKTNQ